MGSKKLDYIHLPIVSLLICIKESGVNTAPNLTLT